MQQSRVADRAGYSQPVRIRLLESDLDENDNAIERLGGRLDKILWTLVGLLVSFTTSIVLLVINLMVSR